MKNVSSRVQHSCCFLLKLNLRKSFRCKRCLYKDKSIVLAESHDFFEIDKMLLDLLEGQTIGGIDSDRDSDEGVTLAQKYKSYSERH